MRKFQRKVAERAERIGSRLVMNLDVSIAVKGELDRSSLYDFAFRVCNSTKDYLAAIKVKRPLIDALGYEAAGTLVRETGIPFIADLKLADIDRTSVWMAKHAFAVGFDAVTFHGFIGEEPIRAAMEEFRDKGIMVIVDMLYPSAGFINRHTADFCKIARKLGVDGVMAAQKVKTIRRLVGRDVQIFATGDYWRGGEHGNMLKEGADFEVIGRNIYDSKDPKETVMRILGDVKERL